MPPSPTTSQEAIHALLTRSVSDVIVRKTLAEKLASGKRLRIKLGVDPTSPYMHLGHAVVLRKLKAFQDAGHVVVFLIGDFTARIGDPSEKEHARKPLTEKEIEKNIERYKEQVGKVLDLKKTEFRKNSEWYKNLDFAELFDILSLFSVQQMMERDMFQTRVKKNRPVWVHELMYPIMQGYDSVALRADVELGGTDQTFNMLAARVIQPHYGEEPQDIMTCQLLEGLDGKEKMSKSLGNTVDLIDEPENMYGKIMSLPDSLIIRYFSLVTDVPEKDIQEYERAMKAGENPKTYKERLAHDIVKQYHGEKLAAKAAEAFTRQFTEKKEPEDMPEYPILLGKESIDIVAAMRSADIAPSNTESRRLLQQGAVFVDGKKVTDPKHQIHGSTVVLKVGRKYRRLTRKK